MITVIFGVPGAGKSSLLTAMLIQLYKSKGRALKESTCKRINELNKKRAFPLTFPTEPPIFSDFCVKVKVDYEKYYSPYYINGYYFGMPNNGKATQYLPPNSKVFLSEVQRYYNSRKSANFPEHVSRLFEMHRHINFDIYMDIQRIMLVDSNIRELCKHYIEVQKKEHCYDDMGRVIGVTWYCREFFNQVNVEQYLKTGIADFKETTYTYDGDIYKCYDSNNHESDFIPEDIEGKDFDYLPFLDKKEIKKLSPEKAKFYSQLEPPEFRGKPEKNKATT
ncbi:MAG: zonular occludens toxin domain-containing protein [Candidatus Coproplasma sp.]